jgi:rhodanese-related sulfurtransferase
VSLDLNQKSFIKEGIMAMKKEEVYQEMKEEEVIVLSVLPAAEYQKLRIRDSFNVPLGDDHQAFVRTVEDQYGRDKFFILYASDAQRSKSAIAAKILHENGFDAEDFPGGIKEWMESGYPVEGTMAEELAILD